jgi:hypothetical protein
MKRFFLVLVFVGIYFQSVFADYSLSRAVLSSAVLPGSGQLYLNKSTKAGIFFASELALLFSFYRFRSEREWSINSYQQFANKIVGLELDSDESDYNFVQQYFSYEEYNNAVYKFARDRYLMFNSDTEGYYTFWRSI